VEAGSVTHLSLRPGFPISENNMPLTSVAKHVALDAIARATAPALSITHVGLMSKGADITAVTGVTSTDIFTKTAHGLVAGDVVVFSGLTGGANMISGHPYFVSATNLAANTFSVSKLAAGTPIHDLGTDVTAATVNKLSEVSGGSPAYARVAIAFAVAAEEISDDSTNGAVVNVPAVTVSYVSFHSASTAGTLMGIQSVTPEVFAAQGTYTVNDAKIQLTD
jgi:hypothetical protein